MKVKTEKTYNVTPKDIKKEWFIIDAAGKPMGKVAERAAYVLRGKHKAIYEPHLDIGDNVVIINAAKAVLTGNKVMDKTYYRHSYYPGGLKSTNYAKLIEKHPCMPMEKAIKGMLPKTIMGKKLFKNIRVYKDDKYDNVFPAPKVLDIK
jgi:large subunit ribosomal protein L13